LQIDSQSESSLHIYEEQAESRLARFPDHDLPPIAEINQVEDEVIPHLIIIIPRIVALD
jgi:hypothetical protein